MHILVAMVVAVKGRLEVETVVVYGRPLQLAFGLSLHIAVKLASLHDMTDCERLKLTILKKGSLFPAGA